MPFIVIYFADMGFLIINLAQNFVVPSASPTWTQSYGSCEVVVVNQAQKAGFPDMDIVMCPFYVVRSTFRTICY